MPIAATNASFDLLMMTVGAYCLDIPIVSALGVNYEILTQINLILVFSLQMTVQSFVKSLEQNENCDYRRSHTQADAVDLVVCPILFSSSGTYN